MSKEPEIPVRGNIVDPDVNTPTGYYLESVKIKPHYDDEFDITNMVAFFNISEIGSSGWKINLYADNTNNALKVQ